METSTLMFDGVREREKGRKRRERGGGRFVRVGDRWTYLAHLPGNDSLHTRNSLPPSWHHLLRPPQLTLWPIGLWFDAAFEANGGMALGCQLASLMGRKVCNANRPINEFIKAACSKPQDKHTQQLCACVCFCVCACVRARTTARYCAKLMSWRSTVKQLRQIADLIVSWAEDGQRPVVITIFTERVRGVYTEREVKRDLRREREMLKRE